MDNNRIHSTVGTKKDNLTYLALDYYSFQSNVSPRDIQMLFDLLFYSMTIFCPTINQDDIYTILGCVSLRKLQFQGTS